MFKKITLLFAGVAQATDQTYGLKTFMQLNSMVDPNALSPMIINLRQMENNLGNAKLELQNMVDPVTAMAAVSAGVETAGKVMDIVERGAGLVGDAIKWADKVTDEAADVKRIKGVLDFI